MATFVLVHGGWSGAHCWREVRRLLAAEGHEVFTPSLTGIGERVHLVSPQVDLTTHVHDVVNLMLFEDLGDVVLVGYSYGGAVVTAALAHISDRWFANSSTSTRSCLGTARPSPACPVESAGRP